MALPSTVSKDSVRAVYETLASGSGGVIDSAGAQIFPDNFAQVFAYTGGVLTSVAFTDGTNTWTQTMSYTSGNLTGISKWVKT